VQPANAAVRRGDGVLSLRLRPCRCAPIRQLALPGPQDYQDGGCVRRRGRTAWGV